MSVGSPFDPRTAPLNAKRRWRDWAGVLASSAYAASHDIEYNAIRNAAALIDVSPLFKYHVHGRDAVALVDRVITRDASRIGPGRVVYTPWCDEHGKVIDDGTVARLEDGPHGPAFRWTAADPQLRWLRLNARGLEVAIDDVSDAVAALALQGPLSRAVLEAASGEDWSDVGYYRRRPSRIAGIEVDVSRTGYTGDLGYEVWVDRERATALWDALMDVGAAYGIRPAGMLALDVARVEAGLILLEIDYTSARHALIPEQSYSPYELGLGRLVALDKATPFVGRAALRREIDAGGPARRLVGLAIDWHDLEALYASRDLSPALAPEAWREQVPVSHGGRQVGRATSGTWSPTLKQNIALAQVDAALEPVGTRLWIEWTVEGRRGKVGATVVPLPFFDPERKRA
jgi:aminomethyltransferase